MCQLSQAGWPRWLRRCSGMKRTSFRMIASSSQGQALYVCFNKWKTVKSTKGRLCELHDSMYVIPACYKLHEKLEYLCSTKTLSSEGVWENLQQQVLPSSSLYEQNVFSKGEQQKSCLTHMSQSKRLLHSQKWQSSLSNYYEVKHSKNIWLHQKGCKSKSTR